jgi:hypothetical protein
MRTMNDDYDRRFEEFLDEHLDQFTLEEFFEFFDLTPREVARNAYYSGLFSTNELEQAFPRWQWS